MRVRRAVDLVWTVESTPGNPLLNLRQHAAGMIRGLTSLSKLAMRRMMLGAAGISAVIVAVALIADFVFNVWLMPGVTPYTPWGTLVIALLTAPPFVISLMLQTEQVRQAQQDLAHEQAARISAEAVNAARTRFLANLSHELRTPLNAIIGYSELMLETAEQEGRPQDVADHARVMGGAKRLLHLLNDLLDLAKLETGRLSLTLADFDVRSMIEEAIALARPDIERNRNRVLLEIDEQVSSAHTDAFRLGQCILNLLTNAAKFTSDGVITINADREVEADEWLVISVKDTGPGIAPERQPLLFEPFMQSDVSGANPTGGSGLGLALTRQLAILLGGGVSLKSETGNGACFVLRVPLSGPPAAGQNDARELSQAAAA